METKELIKILPAKPGQVGKVLSNQCLYLDNISSISEMDEYVVLHSSVFENLFGKTLKSSCRFRKLLPIVKITYKDSEGNKKSIHRAYRSEACQGFGSTQVALTTHSIRLLSEDGNVKEGDQVTVSKGSWLKFFLFHPNRAVFSSTWIGLIGIMISIISLVLAIVL